MVSSHTRLRASWKLPDKEYKTAREYVPERDASLPNSSFFIEKSFSRTFQSNVAFAVMQKYSIGGYPYPPLSSFSAMTSFISFVDDFEIVFANIIPCCLHYAIRSTSTEVVNSGVSS